MSQRAGAAIMTAYDVTSDSIGPGDRIVLNDGDSLTIESGVVVKSTAEDVTGRDAVQDRNGSNAVTIYGTASGFVGVFLGGGENTILIGIDGTATGTNAGIELRLGGNSITNEGTIESHGYGLYCGRAPAANPLLPGSGNDTLINKGLIKGIHSCGVRMSGGGDDIENSGSIYCNQNNAIRIVSTDTDSLSVINNTGTITSHTSIAAILGDGAAAFTNSGMVKGGIIFGASDDSYIGRSGWITAAIFGGDGDDTLLGGRGTETLNGGGGGDLIKGLAGNDVINGGGGANFLYGGNGDDHINIANGGGDFVKGGGGNDVFFAGAAFSSGDTIDGQAGSDTLELAGDYSGGLTFAATNITQIETLLLDNGYSYSLTLNDDAVEDHRRLTIDASNLDNVHQLTLDATDKSGGHLFIFGGEGDDLIKIGNGDVLANSTILAGAGNNLLELDGDFSAKTVLNAAHLGGFATVRVDDGHSYNLFTQDSQVKSGGTLTLDASALSAGCALTFTGLAETDGAYHITGGSGDDIIRLGHVTVLENSTIDASGGINMLELNGDFSAGAILDTAHETNFSVLKLDGAHTYLLTSADNFVANGHTLTVNAAELKTLGHLTFDGSAETNGHFVFESGAGSDTLTGGQQGDTFAYDDGITLSGVTRDTLRAFDFSNDLVKFANVTGIDGAVTSGAAFNASIDGDLAAIFGFGQAHELGANHAVLFTPDTGDLAGDMFLIVDGDGVAGYTAGPDLVIQLAAPLNVGGISTSNFTG